MKKIAGIFIAALCWTNLNGQNPVQRTDTMIHPTRTDSVDFKGQSYSDSTSQRKDLQMGKEPIPLDDRKPPKPPKKK